MQLWLSLLVRLLVLVGLRRLEERQNARSSPRFLPRAVLGLAGWASRHAGLAPTGPRPPGQGGAPRGRTTLTGRARSGGLRRVTGRPAGARASRIARGPGAAPPAAGGLDPGPRAGGPGRRRRGSCGLVVGLAVTRRSGTGAVAQLRVRGPEALAAGGVGLRGVPRPPQALWLRTRPGAGRRARPP
jgi:hypothetical protein